MGGLSGNTLGFSLGPTKDEPPATRQRNDGDFGTNVSAFGSAVLAVRATKGAAMRKRPSPRPGRSRPVGATSPWPDSTSAVHARVAVTDDSWTILRVVEQLEVDHGQIAMLNGGVENLHTSRFQGSADRLRRPTGSLHGSRRPGLRTLSAGRRLREEGDRALL